MVEWVIPPDLGEHPQGKKVNVFDLKTDDCQGVCQQEPESLSDRNGTSVDQRC